MRPKMNRLKSWRPPSHALAFAASAALLAVACAPASLGQPAAPAAQPPAAQPATRPATRPAAPRINPDADRILSATSKLLADAKAFSFSAEIWEDTVLRGGHKLQSARTADAKVRRPDRLQVEARSARKSRGIWYDGRTVTILNRHDNYYGVMDAPPDIDKLVDAVTEKSGVAVPLGDFILSDVRAAVMPDVKVASYIGPATVLGVKCHHLGFITDQVDWQLWVEDGPRPLIRKLVITYTQDDAQPQFTAIITNWNLEAELPDAAFHFSPPQGATKVPVHPADPPADAAPPPGGDKPERENPKP
jgi:hypothetical protein